MSEHVLSFVVFAVVILCWRFTYKWIFLPAVIIRAARVGRICEPTVSDFNDTCNTRHDEFIESRDVQSTGGSGA